MYANIVVGYDESLSSKAALQEASLRIKRNNGKLCLVHAVYFDHEEFAVLPSQLDKRFAFGTNVCRDARKSLLVELGLNGNVESYVCQGEPPEVILETAHGNRADLIALGTYGRKGLKRLLMGSVTSGVILNAPCDVLVVRKACTGCTGRYRSLLVPFDGSESSKKALTRASALAKEDGAVVSVVYVIPRYEEMVDFFKTEAISKSLYEEAEKLIQGARSMAAGLGIEIKAVVQEGHAGEKITEMAERLGNDLILIGTHGWRGVNKAIMGSTAERIIAYAQSPVLVVK